MEICVVGAGWVGLATAVVLADLGHAVWLVEKETGKVELLRQGRPPLAEPGLAELFSRHFTAGRLRIVATSNSEAMGAALAGSTIFFICVGTPPAADGACDLRQVREAMDFLLPGLGPGKILAIRSTVPVGTAAKVAQQTAVVAPGTVVISNPEFLREGTAVHDARHPDRIILGVNKAREAQPLEELYRPLQAPILTCSWNTAEMTKYAANAFLAARISFMNEIAGLCQAVGADVTQVARGLGFDPRIGPHFLQAGIGFGGPCLGKDLNCLRWQGEQAGIALTLLQAAAEVNARLPRKAVDMLLGALGSLEGRRISIWGLTFKGGAYDLRESPALQVAALLEQEGASLSAYDPACLAGGNASFPSGLRLCQSPYAAVTGAEALAVLADWEEFRHINWPLVRDAMVNWVIFDGRNFLDRQLLEDIGFTYLAPGRPER